jgi:hypothetical protein
MNTGSLFQYKIDENDETINQIRYKEKFFSYDEVLPTNFPNSIKDLADEITNDKDLMIDYDFSTNNHDLNYVKSSSKKWNELGINLQEIQCFKPDFNFKKYENNFYVDKEFCEGLICTLPTALPINLVNKLQEVTARACYLDFPKYNAVLFKDILLPIVDKRINSCIYAHEITHVEMENAGGGINKLTNSETLPIFIELLFSNKIEDGAVTNNIIKHRLAYLSGAINRLIQEEKMDFQKRIKLETYVISIIQAINLYNKYMEGNDNIKKEFIHKINNIFMGKRNTEDLLSKYDSNYMEVEHNVKTLKKNYKPKI